MILRIINLHKKFSSSGSPIMKRPRNPYIQLDFQKLTDIINQQINTQINKPSLQKINTLISISVATKNNQMYKELQMITSKCVNVLDIVQRNINNYQEDFLKSIQLEYLFQALPQELQQKQGSSYVFKKLSQLYSNTYCHLISFDRQLRIYQYSCKNHNFDMVKDISYDQIQSYVNYNQLSLSNFIAYLRLFYHKISSQQLQNYLQKYMGNINNRSIDESQKLMLFYLVIKVQPLLTKYLSINYLNLEPNLSINSIQNPKQTCLKLQILNFKGINSPDLNFIDLNQWDYDHLIWVSQFCLNSHANFKDRLHLKLMDLNIKKSTNPFSILTYANNAKIQEEKHIQINKWLCNQPNIDQNNEQSLCKMLIQINQNHWSPFYQQFLKHVLKLSLGNFKWQSQNIVYYFGEVFKIKDENMEYLRRYILNTYASLGTARRQIPTSSYFYKILQITNVQKFYKDL